MSFVPYIPAKTEQKDYERYFQAQVKQYGYGRSGFIGDRYQRGAGLGSFLRSLFRTVVPIAKTTLKKAGKSALKAGLTTAGSEIADQIEQVRIRKTQGGRGRAPSRRKKTPKKSTTLQKGKGLGRRPVKRTLKPINRRGRPRKFICKQKDIFTQ